MFRQIALTAIFLATSTSAFAAKTITCKFIETDQQDSKGALSITINEGTAEITLDSSTDKKALSTLKACKVLTTEKDLPAYLKPAQEDGKPGANEPIPLKAFVQCQESQDSEFGVLLLNTPKSDGPANAAAFQQGMFAVALACEEKK